MWAVKERRSNNAVSLKETESGRAEQGLRTAHSTMLKFYIPLVVDGGAALRPWLHYSYFTLHLNNHARFCVTHIYESLRFRSRPEHTDVSFQFFIILREKNNQG